MNAIETPPNQRRLQVAQRSPVDPNVPLTRLYSSDDDDYAELNRRAQSVRSNKGTFSISFYNLE